jgi:hypothetical protein
MSTPRQRATWGGGNWGVPVPETPMRRLFAGNP